MFNLIIFLIFEKTWQTLFVLLVLPSFYFGAHAALLCFLAYMFIFAYTKEKQGKLSKFMEGTKPNNPQDIEIDLSEPFPVRMRKLTKGMFKESVVAILIFAGLSGLLESALMRRKSEAQNQKPQTSHLDTLGFQTGSELPTPREETQFENTPLKPEEDGELKAPAGRWL